MRIGEINQDNYAEYLKMFGGTNTKTLDHLWGKDKEKAGADAKPPINHYVMEGMLIEDGDTSYQKIVPISDDLKKQLYELVKREYVENAGMTDGEDFRALQKEYIKNTPADKRLSVSWTIDQVWLDEAKRLSAYVKERQPDWQPGQPVNSNSLDGYVSGGVDVSV